MGKKKGGNNKHAAQNGIEDGEQSYASRFVQEYIKSYNVGPTRDLTSDAEVDLTLQMAHSLLSSGVPMTDLAEEVYSDCLRGDKSGKDCKPPNVILAMKEAESYAALEKMEHSVHLTVVFPMYHEHRRMQPCSEKTPSGQNFVRNKVKQLQWLFEANDRCSFDLIAVDDGCDMGSTSMLEEIIKTEGYGDFFRVAAIQDAIDAKIEMFSPLKTPADSRKGGSVLYGLYLAHESPHPAAKDKQHLVMFTDSDMSASMAMAGLLMEPIANKDMRFASAARYGYPTSYLVTETGACGDPESHYRQPNVVHITVRHFLRALLLPMISSLYDTNVGYKCFRVSDLPLFLPRMTVFGPAFDMQLLLEALRHYDPSTIAVAPILFVEDFAESNFTSNSNDPDASSKGFVRMAHEICAMHKIYVGDKSTEEQQAWVPFLEGLTLETYKNVIAGIEAVRGRHLPFGEEFTLEEMKRYADGEFPGYKAPGSFLSWFQALCSCGYTQ